MSARQRNRSSHRLHSVIGGLESARPSPHESALDHSTKARLGAKQALLHLPQVDGLSDA
jgi:hypothetical protein